MCFFTKSYWDFFFPSFNYHSDHVAMCFIVESCTLFPAALLRACLPLEGLLIPGWSLQAVSDSSSSGWSSWGSLSCFRNWLTRKLFLSQCSNPGEVGLQTCCPGSDGAVMGQWWGHVSATHLMLWVGHQPCCSMLCQGQLSWATHHMLFWKSKPQLVSCLVQLKWVLISAEHLDWDQPGLFTTCRKKKDFSCQIQSASAFLNVGGTCGFFQRTSALSLWFCYRLQETLQEQTGEGM